MHRMRRPTLLLLAILVAAPVWGYTVVLKDGTQIVTQEKPDVQGDKAHLVLQSGMKTFIDASEIDFERTEEVNRQTGGAEARVLGSGGREIGNRPPPSDAPPSLGDVAGRTSLSLPEVSRRGDAAPTVPLTTAGFVDLARIPRQPPQDVELGAEVTRQLASQGIEELQVFEGSEAGRLLVVAATRSESAVFKVLRDTANVLVQTRTRFPERLDAVEIYMEAEQNIRAGQFVLTEELAQQLLSGAQEPEIFFYRHVQF